MAISMTTMICPLFAIAIAASKGGTVAKFSRASATSADTARRPGSLGIRDLDAVRSAAKRELLVPTDDGRYYINVPKYRRRSRMITCGWVAAGIVLVTLTALSMLPGRS